MKKEIALPGWHPDQLLQSAAARRGLTVEQYRARISAVVARSAANGAHLTLQSAKSAAEGGELADEELAHLEKCSFCGQLVGNIEASDERVRTFDDALRRAMEVDSRGHESVVEACEDPAFEDLDPHHGRYTSVG